MIDEKKLIESLRASLNTGRDCFPIDLIIECIEEQPKVDCSECEAVMNLKAALYDEKKKTEWIPSDEPPKNDDYILLSFDNFSGLLIGRYDTDEDGNGAYYLGDCCDEDTCVANDMFVNAWQPLPEPYNSGTERMHTNGDRICAMSDEELAEFIMKDIPCDLDITRCDDYCLDGTWNCKKCIMDWLQSEVEVSDER